MSRYTYAGDFKNPTENMRIANSEAGFIIECLTITPDMVVNCAANGALEEAHELAVKLRTRGGWTPHTNGTVFEEWDDADAWLDSLREKFETDYDDYLEENRHSIVQMERYEQWRNEF